MFIGHPPKYAPDGIQRCQGYIETLRNFALRVEPDRLFYGDYSSRSGYDGMQKILVQEPDVDGVFCCSDFMAIGAMEALREKGRQVPQAVSVVGFDDISLASHCSPPLTTVHQDLLYAGKTLVRNLIQFIDDRVVTRTILPVEFVIRKSSIFHP